MARAEGPDQPAVHNEHRELFSLIERLRAACDGGRRDADAVRDLASELTDELAEHFRHEEDGGYFTDALRKAPQLAPAARDLVAQHGPLMESAEALNSMAQSGVESDAWWDRIEGDLDVFSQQLRRHEAGERDLLQRAYNEDIGTKD
ncbi:hemerythrin domain-containing protein [Botrimarina sp.]|uniref:hemerythrin domain-containing protein n=1 Tax=Botrimarina sp. TaxID=2795802 RepID=UPI0032EEE1AA